MAETANIPLGKRELPLHAGLYIAECLKEQGVEVAFGVHGGHIWQIVDAMSDAGIKLITVRHEQAAVYAAEAYAKVTGKPGVAYATAGPGVVNMASAIQQAYLSCSPVILLLGGSAWEEDGAYTLQAGYAEDSLGKITKWTKRLVHESQFKHFVTTAFKDALAYPKGPVALEFSVSTLWTIKPPSPNHALYTPQWRGEETSKPISIGGDPELIERAVQLIYEAKKPLIIAADGIHWSGGDRELVEFAELTQIPTTARRIARGAIPETHPLYFSSRIARQALRDSDLVIAIGMKIGFFDGFGATWPKCIQINESPAHIWTFVKTALAVIGSPRVVLKQMLSHIKGNNLNPPAGRAEWSRQLQDAQNKNYTGLQARAEKYAQHQPVHYGYLAKALWDFCEERYGGMNRIVIDGYTMSSFAPSFIRARYSGQVMDASEHAGVGHGIGMVIGAALGDPEMKKRPMVALMGDSGVGLAGMDIETAARFNLPVVYLVNNNNGWLTGMKYLVYGKNWEALGPQDQGLGQECLPDIRYDKMFEETGCHGEWVTEPAQIRPALDRAFTAAEGGKPAVVNVKMDPTVTNTTLSAPGAFLYIPWDKLPKRGKAIRRQMRNFPWDELGIPQMPMPDPWEPLTEEEMLP